MYPGPNHMRDRHGNNPDLRPDQRMSLNSNLEPRRDSKKDHREKERQEARALREKGFFPRPTAVVQNTMTTPAMFTLVKRLQPQPDNPIAKILGPFSSFAGSDQNLELMGVEQQPGTPAPSTEHHDAHKSRPADVRPVQRLSNTLSSRTNSSSYRPHTNKSPTKAPVKPSAVDITPAASKSKPALVIDDTKLAMIFTEMADLKTPLSALRETPRHEFSATFNYPSNGKNEVKIGKNTKPASTHTLENFTCDLSDDSDLESTPMVNGNEHSNSKKRKNSTTSQNSDDSSNSDESSCSDSEESSSNSSEEDKPTQPESLQMPMSPAAAAPTAFSWSLESLFKPQNGSSTKEEIINKTYEGYDSLSRSPHRTDLAPPIITKEPVKRNRQMLEDISDGSTIESPTKKSKPKERLMKYVNNMSQSPLLSESESEDPVAKQVINVHKKGEDLYKEKSKPCKSSLPCKPAYSRERPTRKGNNSRGNVRIERILTDDSESETDLKPVSKSSNKNPSRRTALKSTSKSPKSSKKCMYPPVPPESKPSKMTVNSPPIPQVCRQSSNALELRGNPSKRDYSELKSAPERSSNKSIREDRSKPTTSSPPFCHSVSLKLKVPKLIVVGGQEPSAVILIPLDLVKSISAEKLASPIKINKQVIEMRTSPSNEDAKKLRAICSIYKGSKKRTSSQERDRTKRSPKMEESLPTTKPEIAIDDKKKKHPRNSTPLPEAVVPPHSSSRQRLTTEVDSESRKVVKEHSPTKEDKRRKRKLSEDKNRPNKRVKSDFGAYSNETEHKARSEKIEGYRSYVKDSSSPVPSSSSRAKRPSSRTSQNADIQEFVSVERNSDDDSCFRTPQQVQGCKESSAKRQKLEDRTVPSKASLNANTNNDFTEVNMDKGPGDMSYFSFLNKPRPIVAVDHMPYLLKAKELKHQADKETNRILQVMIYLESGLYFILTGESMEHQDPTNGVAPFSMYNDTLKFIRHVSSIIARKENCKEESSQNNLNPKLAVLSLRCQSLLYLKLYSLREKEARECQSHLVEYFKAASKSPTVPIAWNPAGQVMAGAPPTTSTAVCGRIANSPSSLSPTPSPAGSVGSEGSQSSSGYGTEGASQRAVTGAMSGTPPMIQTSSGHLVPKNTFVSLQRHLSISNFLAAAHLHWQESETHILESNTKDFFISMDCDLGPLTLHSTPSELVLYVQKSLDCLRSTQSI